MGTPLARSDASPLTFSRVAAVLGVSRRTLYTHWETSADFAEDVAAVLATDHANWQAQLAAAWDGRPFAEAVASTLDLSGARLGAARRAGASARPTGSRTRRHLAAWELRWFAQLSDRLRLEYGSAPDPRWDDVAVAVTATLEGLALTASTPGTVSLALHDSEIPRLAAELTEGIARHLAAELADLPGPLLDDGDEEVAEPWGPKARALVEAAGAAVRAGTLSEGGADRRLIDSEVLARTLGISSRRLYQLWPTPADLNAALFGECLRRLRTSIEHRVLESFTQVTSSDRPETVAQGLVRWNDQMLDVDALPDATRLLGLLELATSEELARRFRPAFDSWFNDAQMQLAAVLQARGRQLVTGRSLADWALMAIASYLGALRLVRTHDRLAARSCTYIGLTVNPLAAAMDGLSHLWTVPSEQGA